MTDRQPPPEYRLRQRQHVTRRLLLRGSGNEFGASIDAHYESEVATFLDKVFAELVGRDAPSAIGKAIRILVPISVVYQLGLLANKSEVILGAVVLYVIAGTIFFLTRRSRKKATRAQERIGDQAWVEAAQFADDALSKSSHLLTKKLAASDPQYLEAMHDLNEANRRLLLALQISKRWWTDWRFVDESQTGEQSQTAG